MKCLEYENLIETKTRLVNVAAGRKQKEITVNRYAFSLRLMETFRYEIVMAAQLFEYNFKNHGWYTLNDELHVV